MSSRSIALDLLDQSATLRIGLHRHTDLPAPPLQGWILGGEAQAG